MRRLLRILRNTLLGLIALVVLLLVAVNLTPVQNWLASQAARILSDKLGTEVHVGHIRIDFRNRVLLQGLYVEDRAGDTLLAAGEAQIRITDWFFLHPKETPVIRYLGLRDVYANLSRTPTSDVWNYQFIVDAFDTGPRDKTKPKNEFRLDLEKLDLRRVRFRSVDGWAGKDAYYAAESLELDADEVDLRTRRADISRIIVTKPVVRMRGYRGGRANDLAWVSKRAAKRLADSIAWGGRKPVDTTPFNPGHWNVNINQLRFTDGALVSINTDRVPVPGQFDGQHLEFSNIDFDARAVKVVGDTVQADLEHLSGADRCGFVLKKLAARITLSPIASVCENLVLETPHSRITNYYAMRYSRFPDFTDYIHKVRMEADFDDARVDSRDVAFFAPALRRNPVVVRLSGNFRGRVDSFYCAKLSATDGSSRIRGDLSMVGLPDIQNTAIRFTNGDVFTTGPAMMRWAPALRNNKSIAVERIQYAGYRGSFVGTIGQFAANGVLVSNLGTIRSDVALTLPPQNIRTARYAGTVSTQGFQLGTLLRNDQLGAVSMRARISGTGFDPQSASINIEEVVVSALGFRGYTYTGISADGVLSRRRFEGRAIVDDPNLALSFDGALDFSGEEPVIAAKAYLLNSDFKTLRLTKDSLRLTADFDLNTVGTDLNDFVGQARLYNINLSREGRRLDIDSVVVASYFDGPVRTLNVESNDVTAMLRGQFRLTDLPQSLQRYLGGYLPAYFDVSEYRGAEQSLAFDVTTRQADDVLAVLTPNIRGFNNTTLQGSLNTATEQLVLSTKVGEAHIGPVNLRGVALDATGDYRQLVLKGGAQNLTIGDSFLNAQVALTTSLGSDSLRFSLTTTSSASIGTASLAGAAYARGDSLNVALMPSEIFINGVRWEIPAGNRAVLGKKYLLIRDFVLQSGQQRIAINTENESTEQGLRVNIERLYLGPISALAGLKPPTDLHGRLSGTVHVENLFRKPSVTTDLQGANFRIGGDTLGNLVLRGNYNGEMRTVTVEQGSGIFRDGASLTAAGNLSLDSNRRSLQGKLELDNAPFAWIRPFASGLIDNLSGTMRGSLTISGTAKTPDIDGRVTLHNAGLRVPFVGTQYTIPFAGIDFTNTTISAGKLTVYDRFKNPATITGDVRHNRFKDLRLALTLDAEKFEGLNLRDFENPLFYGNLIAKAHVTMTGPLQNMRMDIFAEPAGPSQLFLPIGATGAAATYNYVSFASYGDSAAVVKRKAKNKLSISITAITNPLASVTMILDPSTGDAINATGRGAISVEIPPSGDLKMYGAYEIEKGDYTFTLKQVAFQRRFLINPGSRVTFLGPITQTALDVSATYPARARLYDLLTEQETKLLGIGGKSELEDARATQRVDLMLRMQGDLEEPKYSYTVELPERRGEGSYAYSKLQRLNRSDRDLFDQVASLLLIGSFLRPEGGLDGSAAGSVVVNNLSDAFIAGTASGQVTNLVNRILRDDKLSVDLKYRTYSAYDFSGSTTASNNAAARNEFRFGFRRNFLNDRLILEAGSSYDWGRPTATTNRGNFNPVGDFRAQYLLSQAGRLRLTLFRTANFDVLFNKNISRTGGGLSYRRTFERIGELWGRNYSDDASVSPSTPPAVPAVDSPSIVPPAERLPAERVPDREVTTSSK